MNWDTFQLVSFLTFITSSSSGFSPSLYQIQLRIPMDSPPVFGLTPKEYMVSGKVKISGMNRNQTRVLTVFTEKLVIVKESIIVKIISEKEETIEVQKILHEQRRWGSDTVDIQLEKQVEGGKQLEIYMEYVASIVESDSEIGLFMQNYTTSNGTVKKFVGAILRDNRHECNYASRMFPCFEASRLKSRFELTLIHQKEYSCIFNTKLLTSTPDKDNPGWVVDTFAKTNKISPDSVTFHLSDFAFVEAHYWDENPVRFHSPEHVIKAGIGEKTVKTAAKILNFYGRFYKERSGVSDINIFLYPNKKALKQNGSTITWLNEQDEYGLLQSLAIILLQDWMEISWREMYYHEAINTYISNLAIENLSMEQFHPLIDLQYKLNSDSSAIFRNQNKDDPILANKGAAVLHMLEEILPRETIRRGISSYLEKISTSPEQAKEEVFFQSLENAALHDGYSAPMNISDYLRNWSNYSSYPIVIVKRISKNEVALSQEKFLAWVNPLEPTSGLTDILVTMTTEDGRILTGCIDSTEAPLIVNLTEGSWIITNINGKGYYRTWYEESLLQGLQSQLVKKYTALSYHARRHLLDDYFVFSEKKNVSIPTALNLTRYLDSETSPVVWLTAKGHLKNLIYPLMIHPDYEKYHKYIASKVDPAFAKMGIQTLPESFTILDKFYRDLIIWNYPLKTRLEKGISAMLLNRWKNGPETKFGLDFPLKSVEFKERQFLTCTMIANGGKKAFQFILEMYKIRKLHYRQRLDDYHSCLSCSPDTPEILRVLNETFSEKADALLHKQDATEVMSEYSRWYPPKRSFLIKILSDNIDKLSMNLGIFSQVLDTERYGTQKQLDEALEFLEVNKKHLGDSYKSLKGYISLAALKSMKWMETRGNSVFQWLSEQ